MALPHHHVGLTWRAGIACQLLWIFLLYGCVTLVHYSHTLEH